MVNFLIVGMIILDFAIGFLMVCRMGKKWDDAWKAEHEEFQLKEPTYIVLPEHETAEEMADEIKQYKASHKNCRVILWDATDE